MGDRISPLGWLEDDENERAVSRLLRKAEPDAHDGRFSIYVCPECADINCGAVTAVIERVGESIVWRDFGFQTNYDDTIVRDDMEEIGPFTFNATEYYDVIGSALEKPA